MAETVKRRLTLKNRIALAGIELEGGWIKNPPNPVVHDGSVKFPQPSMKKVPAFSTQQEEQEWYNTERARLKAMTPKAVGEIVSRPMEASETVVTEFVTTNYPSMVNATCGLHVHMSFKHRLNYQRLMTADYTLAMVEGLKAWATKEKLPKEHPLWPRLLRPDHQHCSHTYCGEEQVKQTGKDFHSRGKPHSRYTAINYCYAQHQTVECRLLSMMETPDQAVRAVMEVLAITNRFLAKVRARELRHAARVPPSGNSVSHYRVTL